MSAKTTFLTDKELAAKWNGIAKSGDFQRVLVFARASFMESSPSREMGIGAERIISALCSLAENEEGTAPVPEPGMVHRRETMPEQEKED